MQETDSRITEQSSSSIVENASSTEATAVGHADIDMDLPTLNTPRRRRKFWTVVGIIIITLDLCYLPIVYYYALKYGTDLSLQTSMFPMVADYDFSAHLV